MEGGAGFNRPFRRNQVFRRRRYLLFLRNSRFCFGSPVDGKDERFGREHQNSRNDYDGNINKDKRVISQAVNPDVFPARIGLEGENTGKHMGDEAEEAGYDCAQSKRDLRYFSKTLTSRNRPASPTVENATG